mmetsp:Transcript_63863/g.73237  ORF Transcript_63863/g.73237 Transcript_63863/m.73237 type:complete len:258 (-) Transcript_63863:151-924(-)
MIHDSLIEIFSSQMGITRGGNNFEDTIFDDQKGNIKGSSSKIEDEDGFFTRFLVKTVGDSGSGRLVNNSQNLEARDGTGILGGLSLGVIEIGGHGNNGVLNFLTEIGFSGLLHLFEDHSRDFFRGVLLVLTSNSVDGDIGLAFLVDDFVGQQLLVSLDLLVGVLTTDQSLDIKDSSVGIDGSLIFGGFTNQSFGVGKGNPGGGNSVTLIIGDDFNSSTLVDTNAGVGGTKIDTNDGPVDLFFLSERQRGVQDQNDGG